MTIDAPGWTVTGVRPPGIPDQQVFFSREQRAAEGEAAYDQRNFYPIVAVDRRLEVGLVWKVTSTVERLSSTGKAISLKIPLLAGERVLTSNVIVKQSTIEVGLSVGQTSFTWDSELPRETELRLVAQETDQWVERWHLATSPVWNVNLSGLTPVFEPQDQDLIPAWYPWPGEEVALTFSKPLNSSPRFPS